ncbi:MAG: tripartite tricarboxylate transporter substrate binding protein, partial [Burkholderiales bacterium]|nr:tripartite tricarboxylate transporter substrate binding protein [Burkholderiales bacterium]
MSSRCPARPLTAVIVTLVCCSGVIAQEFPSRPLRLMVPVGPGSGVDVIARALAPALSADLGRPVLVENRPGASGNIAAVATLKEKADGHTVLLGIDAIFTTNGHLFPKLDYDPWKDFTLVAPIAETSIFLAAHEKTGATSLAGLLALVRSQPGRYNYSAPVAS